MKKMFAAMAMFAFALLSMPVFALPVVDLGVGAPAQYVVPVANSPGDTLVEAQGIGPNRSNALLFTYTQIDTNFGDHFSKASESTSALGVAGGVGKPPAIT